ncbi:MAG: hypothetical protein ACPGXZ_17200, partial [Saprospiraceae bacterium]
MIKYWFIILGFFCVHHAQSQVLEKHIVNPKDTFYGHYLTIQPVSGKVKSVLLLMPGFSQKADNIFVESMLPYVAANNDILTVAVAGDLNLFITPRVQNRIDTVIQEVLKKYPATKSVDWVMGGFSAGGTISLRYVEQSKAKPKERLVNFKGVFAIDSPVDLIDFWNY